MRVRSRVNTASGSSTTQMVERSRWSEPQMLHGSMSVTLPHTEQKWTASFMCTMAWASSRTVSGGWRSRWNVRRWAVFGPMPGKPAKASMARAIGSIVCTAAGQGIPGSDRLGRDLDALQLGLGGAHADVRDGDGDRAAAGRGLDGLTGQVFLHLLNARLQLAHHFVVQHGLDGLPATP